MNTLYSTQGCNASMDMASHLHQGVMGGLCRGVGVANNNATFGDKLEASCSILYTEQRKENTG